jgi:hypothetical protein
LNAIRIPGRRSQSWITAWGVAKTSTPTSHPKSAIAATPKTKPSETPLASTPSTGTG